MISMRDRNDYLNGGFKSPELVVNLPIGEFNTLDHDYRGPD